jgi:ADP-L-glycero-D-manno-heptose 6-epimerase
MKIYDDQLIIVTGGAGFIGSCIIRYLNDRGLKNIIVVDELGTSEKWKNLVGKEIVDVLDKNQLFSWLPGKESLIEAFIHMGACSDTQELDANYLLENNYRYSVRLAEYALTNNHRFIYASSAATYGDGSKGFVDDESAIFSLEPLNMYGFSKQLFDQWILQQGAFDRVVGLKFFNVFGPNENHKGHMASAITRMVPQILKGDKVRLFKSSEPDRFRDGEQKRDFIYVKDVVPKVYAFLTNDAAGLFNIGSGRASTWNEFAFAVYEALGKTPDIEYIPMPKELEGKYQNYSCADRKKADRALGNVAESGSLREAIIDYVRNYLMTGKRW